MNDSAGNSVNTGALSFIIDTTSPVITANNLTALNNSQFYYDQAKTVNVTFTETNPSSCTLYLNGDAYAVIEDPENNDNSCAFTLASGNLTATAYTAYINISDATGDHNTITDDVSFTVLTRTPYFARGADISAGSGETLATSAGASVDVTSGFAYNINITTDSTSTRWAGLYGNVSGGVFLNASTAEGFYQWSLANAIQGVIIAVNASHTNLDLS